MTEFTCAAPGCSNPVRLNVYTAQPLKYCCSSCQSRARRAMMTDEQRETMNARHREAKRAKHIPLVKPCAECGAEVGGHTVYCKTCARKRKTVKEAARRLAIKAEQVKPAKVEAIPAVKPEKKGPGVANLPKGPKEHELIYRMDLIEIASWREGYDKHNPQIMIEQVKKEMAR